MEVRKTNNKGFTLIELLAVIVILGLLMAIAIPSVTKYITQSRKKTLATTISNYMGALINDANNSQYTFTGTNTIYAVPIECISLERGGTNPFGEWYQANDAYFAYVLVQYDDENSKYIYGFTFKDSAGYGLYPTVQTHIKANGSQIKTGHTLNKPKTGELTSLVSLAKWKESGFNVDSTTHLQVLYATSDGKTGDGINTCTLCQKGNNYAKIEKDKEIEKEEAKKDYTLMDFDSDSTNAFFEYREQIKIITFQDSINIPNEITDEYKWDVSSTGNGKVMAYIMPNTNNPSYYDLYIQGEGKIYASKNSSYLFYNFNNLDKINNLELLDTSTATNMQYMFYYTGYNSKVFTLDLGDNFDTSNVTDMGHMFYNTGYSSTKFTLDLGDKFDTSNVTDTTGMFANTGYSSTEFTLDLGDKFDTSNVTKMSHMFYNTGYSSEKFILDLEDNFNTSNVTDMSSMFANTGYLSEDFTLNLGDNFNTSKVTNMKAMFYKTGYSSQEFTLNLGDNFNTSKATDMSWMFAHTGYSSGNFVLVLGNNFNTSNVTTMSHMFLETGCSNEEFTLNLGDNFNTSKVTDMEAMFYKTGYMSKVFTLNLGNHFNTSNVTGMQTMFYKTGYSSEVFILNLGDNFNTSKVTNMEAMFYQTGYSSEEFTLYLGTNFNTSNVTNMSWMFAHTGYSNGNFVLFLGNNFDTSNVATMSHMFVETGYSSTVFKLDCRQWNVDKVLDHTNFNNSSESKVTAPNW